MRKLYSTCICIVIALIFQAAGLKAEVNATFTATVCPDSGLPIALLGETSEFWLEDMEIDVTGLPDNEYCIVETEVESISWQVTSNVYGEGAHAYVHSIQPGQNGGNGNTGNHDTLVNYGMYQIQFTGSAMVSWWLADNGGYHLAGQKHAPLQVPPKDFGNVWFMFRNPGEDDPETRPHSSGMVDLNEFTFDDSNPGELRIHLISEVYPDEIRPYFPGNLISYTVDGIAGSDLSYSSIIWYPPYTYHSCYAYFEGLPASNSAFGRKTARMFYKGGLFEAHDYEVFFPKNANNHPVCTTCAGCPNWFYYWNQVCGDTNAKFDSSLPLTYRGIFRSSNPSKIYIGFAAGESNSLTHHQGIDCFAETVLHERKHREHYHETHGENALADTDGDWLADIYETSEDFNLNGQIDTEDQNSNGILDSGEDTGLIIIILNRESFEHNRIAAIVKYGEGNGKLDMENPLYQTGTSKYHVDCDNDGYTDEDELCYIEELSWILHSVDHHDWSNPGKQSKNIN